MITTNDIHQQFADFFKEDKIRPYAYLVSKRLQEGHICIDTSEMEHIADEIPFSRIFPAKNLPLLSTVISTDTVQILPFVLHNNRLYLHRYFTYETNILKSIERLLKQGVGRQIERQDTLLKHNNLLHSFAANYDLLNATEQEKTDWQMVAVIQSIMHDFSMITGGPGTGKTTTVAKILSVLFSIQPNASVALAAPTGKAAMRMAESLKQSVLPVDASVSEKLKSLTPNTIHRLLGYIPNSVNFKHNQSNPLPFDVVIVDEASMIDVAVFSKLLDAIGPNTRVILLGDKNQLASVEAGSLFGDLCNASGAANSFTTVISEFIHHFIPDVNRQIPIGNIIPQRHILAGHIVELQKSHRFRSDSGIGKFSQAIIHNEVNELLDFVKVVSQNSVHIYPSDNKAIFENFIKDYAAYIQEPDIAYALKKLNQLRVLCAVREGPQGVYKVNKDIERFLQQRGLLQISGDFYENRPIIITKNYPDLNLFNGDIGLLRKDENGNLRAWFEDSNKNIRSVMPGYLANAETVFAMTVHKSQGSEYANVLVLLPENYGAQLLTRELLYTAITRAKENIVLLASEDLLLMSAKASVKRISGILNRFDEIQVK